MEIAEIVAADLRESLGVPAFANEAPENWSAAPYLVVVIDPDAERETDVSLTVAVDAHAFAAEGQRAEADGLATRIRERLDLRDLRGSERDPYDLVRLDARGVAEPIPGVAGDLESSALRFRVYATKRR